MQWPLRRGDYRIIYEIEEPYYGSSSSISATAATSISSPPTRELTHKKSPRPFPRPGAFLYQSGVPDQTLISTSTPLGSSSFIRASTVFDEVE